MRSCENVVNKLVDAFFCILEKDLFDFDDDDEITTIAQTRFPRNPAFLHLPAVTTETFDAARTCLFVRKCPLFSQSMSGRKEKGD